MLEHNRRLTRLLLTTNSAVLLLCLLAAGVSAQRNPPMAGRQRENEKEMYYARYSELRKVRSGENQRLAYEAGREYLKRFEGDNDADARTVRKFVNEYEKVLHEFEIFTTYNAKNYAKTFDLGGALLQKDPENFFVLGVLAEAGYENALAGNASQNAETIDYTRRAIQLMEAGKVTKPDPFKSMDIAGGFLNVVLGWFLKDQSPIEAAAAFRKALLSESPYRNDPLIYHRLGIAILKGEFAQLSAEYNEKYGSKPPSPEQQAMFARINHLGERAIDAYARAYALSDPQRLDAGVANNTSQRSEANSDRLEAGAANNTSQRSEAKSDRLEAGAANNTSQRPEANSDRLEAGTARPQFPAELRSKILAQLTALYKSFHNNSDAGLNELITSVLSKPLP